MADQQQPLSLVVLISGRGSNLKAILDAVRENRLAASVRAVISSEASAAGLAYAQRDNIDTLVLDGADYPNRDQYDLALQDLIERFDPGLVVLAGFMRILTPSFVRHFRGRLVNIHPSLLPALRGLHTHRRAIESGLEEHGASVHYVTEELDGGPVIAQVRLPVLPDDDEKTLAARVLAQEHPLYCRVLDWIAHNRVRCDGEQVYFDERLLQQPLQLNAVTEE